MLTEGLAARLEGRVTRGRAAATATMQDTCLVQRETGRTAQNEENGLEEPVLDTIAVLPCTVQGSSRSSSDTSVRTVTIGGVERPVIEGGVKLPVTDDVILAGDLITITAIGPVTDPEVLGNKYKVDGFGGKSYATARRLDVVEV